MSELTPEEKADRRAQLEAELAALDEPAPAPAEPPAATVVQENAAASTTTPTVAENAAAASTTPPTEAEFPTPGGGHDPTQEPPPDAAIGAENQWQPPAADATTPPPVSAPTDAQQVAAEAAGELDEGASISETTYAVVASDGSTDTTTPGYSHLPCPVCGNTSLKTTNVAAAQPLVTLKGDTVNPGDQVVVCETCGNTVAAGDTDAFEAEAKQGVYGEDVKAAAEGAGKLSDDQVAELNARDEEDVAALEAELEARRAAIEARRTATASTTTETEGGQQHGNG